MQTTLLQDRTTNQPATCHSAPQMNLSGLPLVVIVGSPNVGKSVLFHRLTGAYVTVSNYPGTTVEVTRGKARLGEQETGVMDTPGMYNLLPITEEEHVAREILLKERPALVVHMVDAKNLERMLPMTLQLIEAGLPVMLVVNLLDEADRLGVHIDIETLRRRLGIPVVGAALTLGRGVKDIRQAISQAIISQAIISQAIISQAIISQAIISQANISQEMLEIVSPAAAPPQIACPQPAACSQPIEEAIATARIPDPLPIEKAPATARIPDPQPIENAIATARILYPPPIENAIATARILYPPPIENALAELCSHLSDDYRLSRRAMAVLLLQDDQEILHGLHGCDAEQIPAITEILERAQKQYSQPLSFQIAKAQRQAAQRLLQGVFQEGAASKTGFAARLSDAMIHPLTGIPILLLALFLLYEFVGVLGAQTLVNWLETHVFDARLNPWVDQTLATYIPWPALRSLIGGDFGVVTLGLRYAFAIILPIVGTFFIAFSIIEDSGYLPRLAMLIDRVFKRIGLNGRAVIPMVLGFGCDTMATITTRTLETRRERLISTLLLSLAIPCSAQMGVMLAMLAGAPLLLPAWLAVVAGVFLLVGFLTAKLLPGEQPTFYMELPPLRLPRARNVLIKTYTRMEWYLREVLPLFLVASVVIWVGTLTGLFDLAVSWLTPVVRWLGLPDQTAVAFLFGFFRRDYGAAGLYDLRATMNSAQLLVAIVTMTLFVPCLAQFAVTVKERGWKAALAMAAFIFPFAILVGGALSGLLRLMGFQL